MVHFGLYAKTLKYIGTERHREYLRRAMLGVDLGCYGLTEIGHGSNVRGMEVTAHYDVETEQFILNSPT